MQLERFAGIFLCATNRLEHLDAAAMRRFDVKVAFDYLSAEPAWVVYRRLLDCLGVARPRGRAAQRLRARLGVLERLTSGDFAAVGRQFWLIGGGDGTAYEVLERLKREQGFKSKNPSQGVRTGSQNTNYGDFEPESKLRT